MEVAAEGAANPINKDSLVYNLPILTKDKLATHWRGENPILCVPGRTGLDEAVASMLAQILSKHGIAARVEGVDAIANENTFGSGKNGIEMVCVSFLNTSSLAQMRFTIRRLRRRLPDVAIVLGSWIPETDSATLAEAVKADFVATTLHDAVKLCLEQASANEGGGEVAASTQRYA